MINYFLFSLLWVGRIYFFYLEVEIGHFFLTCIKKEKAIKGQLYTILWDLAFL